MSRPPDGCVVPSEPLADLIRSFLGEWKINRPPTAGQFAAGGTTTEVSPVRAAEWLATEAKVSESTIQNIVSRRYPTTELRVADALLQALDRPDLLCEGGPFPILPNPSANAAAQAECCGGSEQPVALPPPIPLFRTFAPSSALLAVAV